MSDPEACFLPLGDVVLTVSHISIKEGSPSLDEE
jgi:hypothetical protein